MGAACSRHDPIRDDLAAGGIHPKLIVKVLFRFIGMSKRRCVPAASCALCYGRHTAQFHGCEETNYGLSGQGEFLRDLIEINQLSLFAHQILQRITTLKISFRLVEVQNVRTRRNIV